MPTDSADTDGDEVQVLTIAQAASLLGISRWTVWRLIKDGELPSWQPGGPDTVHIVRRVDVTARLESRAEEARRLAEQAAS